MHVQRGMIKYACLRIALQRSTVRSRSAPPSKRLFGQVGYFHKFACKEIADKRPLDRYVAESKRLLGVLDTRLTGREWMIGDDYGIADIATIGRVRNQITFYEAKDLVSFDSLTQVPSWLERALARSAVQRGLIIPGRN